MPSELTVRGYRRPPGWRKQQEQDQEDSQRLERHRSPFTQTRSSLLPPSYTGQDIMNTILTAGQLLQKLQEATGMILPVLSGHILSHKYLAHNLDDHENI